MVIDLLSINFNSYGDFFSSFIEIRSAFCSLVWTLLKHIAVTTDEHILRKVIILQFQIFNM